MKKKVLSIGGLAAFAAVMVLNINASLKNAVMDVALNNIEASAVIHLEEVVINCQSGSCYYGTCRKYFSDNPTCPCGWTGNQYDSCYYG